MIIEKKFGNLFFDNLIIQNFPNLQSIVVKNYSLQNLRLLKICNCEKLKTIEVEKNAFEYVKSVVIESISEMIFFSKDLPNLQLFKTKDYSFYHTTTFSLSSNPRYPL